MMGKKFIAAACVAALALGGCGANYTSIHRGHDFVAPGPFSKKTPVRVSYTDAKQRAVTFNNGIMCSEPSPDALSALAQSLGASGAFEKGADPTTLGAALNFAMQTSEGAGTISRTQTVHTNFR